MVLLCYSFPTMIRKSILLLTALALFVAALPAAAQKKNFTKENGLPRRTADVYAEIDPIQRRAGVFRPGTAGRRGVEAGHADRLFHSQGPLAEAAGHRAFLFRQLYVQRRGSGLQPGSLTALYPLRLENLPLAPGKDLDTALQARLPLYHGKVPSEGGLDGRPQALRDARGQRHQSHIAAVPYTDEKLCKVTAMSFPSPRLRCRSGSFAWMARRRRLTLKRWRSSPS